MDEKRTQKVFVSLCKKVGYTSKKYTLIEPGDRIMIGVSGGKDSLFLLESLADRIKHLPFKVELIACHVHIKEVGYKIDTGFLTKMCNELGVELHIEELSTDLQANPRKAPCFVCSWHRRKRLFELTKKLNCNKLALGHHIDDAIETLMMNMIYHGTISSLPAKLSMFGGRLKLIRPLIELTNAEMLNVASIREYPQLKSQCPYGDDTNRIKMRRLVEAMGEMNKDARKNIFRSMGRVIPEYLPDISES
ncbi:MAG: tRNA 2-thiocytidine biosynthesis TtcA family protein [Bacteroidota bacterium]|nr:tRNA 2-thiocytidine biosynthesis TtcA family protein [Bacteroidota bacterium]